MQRRALLARLSTLGVVGGVGGCLDSLGDLGDDGTRLARVHLLNQHEQPHTVDFRVRWAEELVHESTHELDADTDDPTAENSAYPDRSWPDEAGSFTALARVDGGEWRRAAPTDWDGPDCLSLLVTVDRRGRPGFYGSVNPEECERASRRATETRS